MLSKIDRTSAKPLQTQIREQLQDLIGSGRLKPGAPMMPTRTLAERLGVSRTTVLLAYEQLIAEGYLQTRPAVGTFVSREPPRAPLAMPPARRAEEAGREAPGGRRRLAAAAAPAIDFDPHRFDGRLFPHKQWRRYLLPALEQYGTQLSFDPLGGLECLRRAIADWLASSHGILVPARRVVIVASRQQAYNIIARRLAPRGSRVVVECTCRDGLVAALASGGARVTRVAIDEHGLESSRLPDGRAALVAVTPSHQFPVGGTLPPARRQDLIAWAQQAGAYIVEDECDNGLWYQGTPPTPLALLAPHERVIHIGDFARALGPGVHVTYLVVPSELVEPLCAARALLGNGGAWLEQVALARFLESGAYDGQLRRMRKANLERRNRLVDELRARFGDVRLSGTASGTHLAWFLPPGFPTAAEVQRLARARDVRVYTLSDLVADKHAWCESAAHTLFLGYAALEERDIREGLRRLAEADDLSPRNRGEGGSDLAA